MSIMTKIFGQNAKGENGLQVFREKHEQYKNEYGGILPFGASTFDLVVLFAWGTIASPIRAARDAYKEVSWKTPPEARSPRH